MININDYEWANDDVQICYAWGNDWLAIQLKEGRSLDLNEADSVAIAKFFLAKLSTPKQKQRYLDLLV